MRSFLAAAACMLSLVLLSGVSADEPPAFDWTTWRQLPVQEGGRHKPLDTLAWETLRTLCNRASFADPETHQQLDATALYLVLLFDWQGWDRPPQPQALSGTGGRTTYFQQHPPDKWDKAPLLSVDFLPLRQALGMAPGRKDISPFDLSRTKIIPPGMGSGTGAETPFLVWAERLLATGESARSVFEKQTLALADKLWAYQDHRMGRRLEVLPVAGSADGHWASVAVLLRTNWDATTDPTGGIRQVKQALAQARVAYRAGAAAEFQSAAAALLGAVADTGPRLGAYPAARTIRLEVIYNRWVPFRFAWVFTLLAALALLLDRGTSWRGFRWVGWGACGAGLAAMSAGFVMRMLISGRAPVTNMYESVIYLALGVTVLGLLFELVSRRQLVLTATAAVATVALVLADNCPAALDPSLQPLQPVLRSNFWLVTHVLTITLSYAAFALALGIGNIAVGYYLVGSENHAAIEGMTRFIYRALQVGVLLLAAGTILGGVWADYAWGRFWGWDPKEVWALVTLLGYVAVLHARYVGWVQHFGLAALSVLCFALVVMAWYGVNFVLGAGLHSYGFGSGGQAYVCGVLVLQGLYVGVAAIKVLSQRAAARAEYGAAPAPTWAESY